MLKRIYFVLLASAVPMIAAAQTCAVPERLWERPRSGQVLSALAELRACVQAHLDKPGSSLAIHHAAADESSLRAAELRYWLMALALDGAAISLENDSPVKQPLTVEVREKK